MSRAAVLGRPIGHSLSPALHRAAYRALGLDWTYEAIDCGVDDLDAVLAARRDWAGFSCTMPLKHAVLQAASAVAPAARVVGAANTLIPDGDGGWVAHNTDVDGVRAALDGAGAVTGAATVLGAGGTAQAVVVALAHGGVERCTVLVRDPARATSLRETADLAGVALDVRTLVPDDAALAADLVVSTLPPGAADAVAGHAWTPEQTVLDVVYAGWPTPLAAGAAAGGARVVSGLSMLLHQAARQVELMTGSVAPLDAMRAALGATLPTQ